MALPDPAAGTGHHYKPGQNAQTTEVPFRATEHIARQPRKVPLGRPRRPHAAPLGLQAILAFRQAEPQPLPENHIDAARDVFPGLGSLALLGAREAEALPPEPIMFTRKLICSPKIPACHAQIGQTQLNIIIACALFVQQTVWMCRGFLDNARANLANKHRVVVSAPASSF